MESTNRNQGREPARRSVELDAGRVHLTDVGEGETLVFAHGFAVNGLLWSPLVDLLADSHRCIVPDLPLGSHPEPMREGADLTPAGIAALLAEMIGALGLDRVTLVGNDSGGAVSQIVATEHPERVARLVLTNCDCLEKFPPGRFKALAKAMRVPGAARAMAQSMRVKANRHSPLAYGALTAKPIPDELTLAWTRPQLADPRVGEDGVRFFTACEPSYTLTAAAKLSELETPVLLAWGEDDPFFTIEDARRLAELIPDATPAPIPARRTFVPLDDPATVA